MKQQPDQNQLAFMLNDKLQNATDKFVREHRAININGIIGAANAYLAMWLTHAPSKADAMKALDEDVKILRNILDKTPDEFFGASQKAKLN